MEVHELVGRLHDLAEVIERRRGRLEESPPEGIALGMHRVRLAALGDDAHFLHELAHVVECCGIEPAYSDVARKVLESMAGEIEKRP